MVSHRRFYHPQPVACRKKNYWGAQSRVPGIKFKFKHDDSKRCVIAFSEWKYRAPAGALLGNCSGSGGRFGSIDR